MCVGSEEEEGAWDEVFDKIVWAYEYIEAKLIENEYENLRFFDERGFFEKWALGAFRKTGGMLYETEVMYGVHYAPNSLI